MAISRTFICQLRYIQVLSEEIHFFYVRSLEYHWTVLSYSDNYGGGNLREIMQRKYM